MRKRLGTVCIIAGAVLIIGAILLFMWNRRENERAGASVSEIMPLLAEQIQKEPEAAEDAEDTEYVEEEITEMTEVEIDGYYYIGYLSIPILDLELPVMTDWSYPQLKIAPCRYTGSTKTNDLVIAAHNYSYHFGNLKNLTEGDMVYFTDMDGTVTTYEVALVETLMPTAIEEMTDSGYDLTLFTCTYGGKSRVTVRCSLAE